MKTRSIVVHPAPASPEDALRHFEDKFAFETDCYDVHAAITMGNQDFVLLDVRAPEFYQKGHVPGAINLPHSQMNKDSLAVFGDDAIFVVYCAGPHCNGASRGAIRLARMGRPVKEMIGGIEGWKDEGFEIAVGAESGQLALAADGN